MKYNLAHNLLQPSPAGDMQFPHTEKTCILITGPTAGGKTSLSIQLALDLQTQIISADSRQCFRELNIGVAKPSPGQLAKVRHYFISSHSIHDTLNAGLFETYALDAIREIFQTSDMAVMVGGTGLYIKAFCDGIDLMPVVPSYIRQQITAGYRQGGLTWLQQQVEIHDPGYMHTGEIQNPRRLMRALEIAMATGRSILSFHHGKKKQRDFRVIKIGLQPGKENLHRNIDHRVNDMVSQGLVDEVSGLLAFRHMNALNTVGYSEVFGYLDGNASLEEAIAAIKLHTRHYAKRQMTWFSKDGAISWFHPDDLGGIKQYIKQCGCQ